MPKGSLLAWIEPCGDDGFTAALVGEWATSRAPATQLCSTPRDAREWIKEQAAAFPLPIRWVSDRSDEP
jgi:hypothetical protein